VRHRHAAVLARRVTITRTVTNVSAATSTYFGSGSVPGWTVSLSPATLTLAPGASATYRVNLTRTSAAIGAYSFGNVVWTDGTHTVTSPLTAKASLFAWPSLLTDNRAAGTKLYTVATGYDGVLPVTATGLVAATLNNGAVATNQQQCFNVVVPAGALHARFQLFNSDTQGGSGSDLDLEVHRGPNGTGPLVGSSGGSTSDELVDLSAPTAATYSACVIGFAPVGGNATFTLSTWVVGPAVGPQSLTAAGPAKVYLGGTASIGLSWSVPAGSRYLGIVRYTDGTNALGSTLFSVDAR
jgi:Fibronectin type-III domain